jgi:parallel beta-helix repeat protein
MKTLKTTIKSITATLLIAVFLISAMVTASTVSAGKPPITITGISSSDSVGTSKGSFLTTDDIYAHINTNDGTGSDTVDLYVVSSHPDSGDALSDVSGGFETVDISGDSTYKVWSHDTTAGTYYIVVDANQNGIRDSGEEHNDFNVLVRSFTATIAPTTANTGETKSYTITITNDMSSSNGVELGSAIVTVPSGFTSVSSISVSHPPGKSWTATLDANEIKLKADHNDELSRGQSVSVTFSAIAPETADTYTWTTAAWGDREWGGSHNPEPFTIIPPQPTVDVLPPPPPTVSITVTSSPSGENFIKVDDASITTPHIFTWIVGSTHTLEALSPVAGSAGTQYVWTDWSDSGTQTHDYIVPGSPETVTANYKTQYSVTFDQTGLDVTATGTVVTIGDITKTKNDLPLTDWFDSGTTYSYANVVSSTDAGKSFKLVSVTGLGSPIISTGTVMGNYEAQYPVWIDKNTNGVQDDGDFNCTTIHEAIDAAISGETILVYPGTYNEDIRIGEALTVRSTDGAEATIIDGTGSYIVIISHSDVTFEGFTVTNPDYAGGADASGILVEAISPDYVLVDNIQILNNIVTQVRSETGTPSMYGATGVNIGHGPLSNIVISGNAITNIHNPDGALVDHTCGINVWDGADNVVISNNSISDIKFNGIILQYANDVQIENNTITECKVGILVDPFEGATVSVTINYNDIVDNKEYGVRNTMVGVTIDATNNWWGDASGPYHATTNLDGLGNAVSDNVNYTPWLGWIAPPPVVPTWPPEPYVEPVNLTEVLGNTDTILSLLSLGEVIPAGDDPTLMGLDYNGDGMVDIADAFDQFVDAGLLRRPSFTFDPDAASQFLATLESVYGENLVNFQPVEGRVWLLYMLGYLPYQ